MIKAKKRGCDYCGEDKEVQKWKGGGKGQWENIYICKDCGENIKEKY